MVVTDSTTNRGLALIALKQKHFYQALALLNAELKFNLNNVHVIHLVGLTLLDSGLWEKSLPFFDKAIEMLPNKAVYHYNRGHAYYNLTKYQLAVDDYTISLKINPTDSLAYYNRALSYEGLQDYKSAIQDYTSDLTVGAKNHLANTYNNRGRCYMNLKQYPEALADYTKALAINPKKGVTYGNRGDLYYRMDKPEEACNDWIKATQFGFDRSNSISKYCK